MGVLYPQAGVTGIQKKAREAIPTTMLPPMPYPKITVLDGLAEESMKTRIFLTLYL